MDDTETGEHDDSKGPLEGIEDGCGCVEIWERLSERRREGTPVPDDRPVD